MSLKALAFDFDGVIFEDHEDDFWFVEVPNILAKEWKMSFSRAQEKCLKLYELFPKDKNWADARFWVNIFGTYSILEYYEDVFLFQSRPLLDFELLDKLKKKYVVGLISNSPLWRLKKICEPFHLNFDFIVTPDNAGAMKPSRKIFDKLKEVAGQPSEILVVGHGENEAAAEKYGFKTIIGDSKKISQYLNTLL